MAWGHSWSRHIMHEFKFSYNSLTNVMLIFFLFSKTEKLFRRQTGVLQWSWALRKSACCLWEWCFMVGAVLVLKVAVPLLSALKKKNHFKRQGYKLIEHTWCAITVLETTLQVAEPWALVPQHFNQKKQIFFFFFWLRRKKAQENFTFIYLCWTSEKKTPQKHLSHKIPFLSLARWTSPQISIWMLIVRNSNMLSNKDEAWEHRKTKDVDLNKPDHINKSGWEQMTRLD